VGRIEKQRIIDPLLTGIVQGFSNPAESYIADKVLPIVGGLTKEAGKIAKTTKDHFKSFATYRAIHAGSNIAKLAPASTISYALDEFDFAVPIDYREEQESNFDLEQGASFAVREIMLLDREVRTATLLTTAGTYSGNTASPSTKWGASNATPIADITAANEAMRLTCGRRANTITFGPTAWDKFRVHPSVVGLIQYAGVGVVTVDIAKTLLGIENLYIADAIKASDADVFSDVWGDNVILQYHAPKQLRSSLYTPSFGFTLVKGSGLVIDKFGDLGGKVNYVRGTTIETPLVHGAVAGYLLSDCV